MRRKPEGEHLVDGGWGKGKKMRRPKPEDLPEVVAQTVSVLATVFSSVKDV